MKRKTKFIKGSQLVEKILMAAFSVAMGGALIVYTSNVIIAAKNGVRLAVETSIPTRAALAFHWSDPNDDGHFTFSNMKIRYTGFVSVDVWNTLNEESPITGYGLKFASNYSYLNGTPLKDAEPDGTNVKIYFGSGDTPTLALDSQKEAMDVPLNQEYYVFSLAKTILTSEEGLTAEEIRTKYTTPYAATAFIILENGDYVYCPEIVASVKDVARSNLDSGHSDISTAGGSIYYLANL